jgi:intein/homing endonuclease
LICLEQIFCKTLEHIFDIYTQPLLQDKDAKLRFRAADIILEISSNSDLREEARKEMLKNNTIYDSKENVHSRTIELSIIESLGKLTNMIPKKDIEHLNKFKKTIKSDSEIKISDNQATLNVNQKKFVKNLINKGCFQAKTFTIKFPEFLREDLKRHFIRGYFDGDGSISQWTYVHKRKNRKDRIETNQQFEITSGSMSILESIKKEILESCKVKNYKICTSKNKHYHRVAWWSKNDIKLIFHYFYDNSNIFLERKKRKFLDIC